MQCQLSLAVAFQRRVVWRCCGGCYGVLKKNHNTCCICRTRSRRLFEHFDLTTNMFFIYYKNGNTYIQLL